jgi:hypothetical protein
MALLRCDMSGFMGTMNAPISALVQSNFRGGRRSQVGQFQKSAVTPRTAVADVHGALSASAGSGVRAAAWED